MSVSVRGSSYRGVWPSLATFCLIEREELVSEPVERNHSLADQLRESVNEKKHIIIKGKTQKKKNIFWPRLLHQFHSQLFFYQTLLIKSGSNSESHADNQSRLPADGMERYLHQHGLVGRRLRLCGVFTCSSLRLSASV